MGFDIEARLHQVTETLLDKMMSDGWFLGPSRVCSHDRPTPWDINNGWCEQWADAAVEAVGGEALWLDSLDERFIDWDDPDDKSAGGVPTISHCVLVLEGRYYDAQNEAGVDTLDELHVVQGTPRSTSC